MGIPRKRKYLPMDAIIITNPIDVDYFPILCQSKHLTFSLNTVITF